MQVPTSIHGLRSALRSLGFEDVLTGIDVGAPGAKEQCRQQIQWLFEQSAQTMQDDVRRKKALSYIERFAWPESMQGLHAGSTLAKVMRAVDELRALLEEEQILRPIEVEEYEEDENGDVQSIRLAASTIQAAEYRGRKVTLNKPFRTPDGPKKFAVYVKNDKGNVVKVTFGDPDMRIKKSDPARRKSFRARHNCDDPGPKWKARYWSCKAW